MVFNWNEQLAFLPEEWRSARGRGVRIAVMDSGLDLGHPDLIHLNVSGRKFDVTRPQFNPERSGDDDVSEANPLGQAHGTQITSVIAAQSSDGITGIAPLAEVIKIKITDRDGESFADYFLRGLSLALQLDVDIISVSYFPVLADPLPFALVDQLFAKVEERNILFVSTLENTKLLPILNRLQFPSNREEAIVAGVIRRRVVDALQDVGQLAPNIDILLPEVEGCFCNRHDAPDIHIKLRLSSSHATALVAGTLALYLSFRRQQNESFHRIDREEVLADLRRFTRPLDDLLTAPANQFIFFQREPVIL